MNPSTFVLQKYFECCGYSMYDTRTWTGACCPGQQTPPVPFETTTLNGEGAGEVSDGFCEGAHNEWLELAEPVISDGKTMEDFMGACGNKVTCSQRFSDLFKQAAIFLVLLGLFEVRTR